MIDLPPSCWIFSPLTICIQSKMSKSTRSISLPARAGALNDRTREGENEFIHQGWGFDILEQKSWQNPNYSRIQSRMNWPRKKTSQGPVNCGCFLPYHESRHKITTPLYNRSLNWITIRPAKIILHSDEQNWEKGPVIGYLSQFQHPHSLNLNLTQH